MHKHDLCLIGVFLQATAVTNAITGSASSFGPQYQAGASSTVSTPPKVLPRTYGFTCCVGCRVSRRSRLLPVLVVRVVGCPQLCETGR